MKHIIIEAKEDFYGEYYSHRTHMHKLKGIQEKMIKFYHNKLFSIVLNKIPDFRNLSILEVGTGRGYFAEICKNNNVKYQGIEANKEQVNTLNKLGYDVVCAMIPPFPGGEHVDIIWMSHVLEHADGYNHARNILIGAKNRLQNGFVVIISPDFKIWKDEFYNSDWSHGYPTTIRRVSQLMIETGFEVHYSTYITATFVNPLPRSIIDIIFWFIPVNLLDLLLEKIAGRPLVSSFMTYIGLRQIFLIGKTTVMD